MTESTPPSSWTPSSGWYSDPWYTGQYRWWDGSQWSADVFPVAVSATGAVGVVEERPVSERPPALPPVRRADPVPPAPTWAMQQPQWQPPPMPMTDVVTSGPEPTHRRPAVLVALLLAVGFVIGSGIVVLASGRSSSTPTASVTPSVPPQNGQANPSSPLPSNPGPSAAPATPTPGGTAGGGVAGATPSSTLLQSLGLQQADLPSDQQLLLVPNGTDASGEPTLDLCNGTFASEAKRVARLQVAAVDANGNSTISTESVLYDSPASTEQAFSEIQQVASRCPHSPVVSPVGEPTVTTTFGSTPDKGWPAVTGVQRLAYTSTTTDAGGDKETSTVVYLRRGKALMGVYLPHAASGALVASVGGRTTAEAIVEVFEHRLDAAPASAVGA